MEKYLPIYDSIGHHNPEKLIMPSKFQYTVHAAIWPVWVVQ